MVLVGRSSLRKKKKYYFVDVHQQMIQTQNRSRKNLWFFLLHYKIQAIRRCSKYHTYNLKSPNVCHIYTAANVAHMHNNLVFILKMMVLFHFFFSTGVQCRTYVFVCRIVHSMQPMKFETSQRTIKNNNNYKYIRLAKYRRRKEIYGNLFRICGTRKLSEQKMKRTTFERKNKRK